MLLQTHLELKSADKYSENNRYISMGASIKELQISIKIERVAKAGKNA